MADDSGMLPEGLDADAFGTLLQEEGVVGVDEHDGSERLVEENVVEAGPDGKGYMRFYPPRKPTSRPTSGTRRPSSGSSAPGSLPSYMRPTAASSVRTGSGGGSGSRTPSPAASSGRPPSPAAGAGAHGGAGASGSARSGTAGSARRGSEDASAPRIAGKVAYSSLPENAGRAEMVKQIESAITAAADPSAPGAVRMEDVVGLEDAKRALSEAITFPQVMAQMGMSGGWTKGVLLFGPPGTGKTQLARAQATSAGCAFFSISSSSIMSKWLGESEKMVKALFDAARYYAPAIVFIDEIDALTGERGSGEHEATIRVKNELLAQMDGMASTMTPDKLVLVLGATNRPWALDEAFRRRLEKRVLIPLPEPITRDALWRRTLTKGGARLAADISYETLVARTDGYSCADIVLLAKDALVAPLRELAAVLRGKGLPITEMPKYIQEHGPDALPAVSMAHLEDALRRIKSSVGGTGSETMRKMAAWAAEYGST